MDTLIHLVEYFRDLATKHKQIEGFLTGEDYEMNDSLHQYPLLYLQLPISSTVNYNLTGDTMNVTLVLSVLTNIILDENGNEVIIREDSVETPHNQIGFVGLVAQDQLLNNSFRIINEIISKVDYDIKEGELLARIVNNSIQTVERVTNNDLYGATLTLTLEVENIYACTFMDAFDI